MIRTEAAVVKPEALIRCIRIFAPVSAKLLTAKAMERNGMTGRAPDNFWQLRERRAYKNLKLRVDSIAPIRPEAAPNRPILRT
jgi:hypothetical protein